jgi:hypothetical protein
MTGKIVNLTRARKARVRDDDRQQADANAARHGQTKSARLLQAAQDDAARTRLDQHKLEEE